LKVNRRVNLVFLLLGIVLFDVREVGREAVASVLHASKVYGG